MGVTPANSLGPNGPICRNDAGSAQFGEMTLDPAPIDWGEPVVRRRLE
jgi:hypothetical protein